MQKTRFWSFWKQKARELKIQTLTLYYAYRHPGVPWYAKLFTALVVAYAFSPIDLIPDFIPVFGYLDDLIIVPLGVTLAMKMIPPQIMESCKIQAQEVLIEEKPRFILMSIAIVGVWVIVLLSTGLLIAKAVRR
jgi:uncharacterized membrane protein YkvA (DUF1232 family)